MILRVFLAVLKGPNAAALYGSRAGNGVILVTTKKGSKKEGFGVRYSGNFTWSKVAETLDMQTRYGQGHINPTGGVEYSVDDSGSWGPVLKGDMVTILFSALTRMFPKPTFAP